MGVILPGCCSWSSSASGAATRCRCGTGFASRARLLPNGVAYHASWIDEANSRCFQLMEAADEGALQPWVARWSDLIDFDVIPVVDPAEYWARLGVSPVTPGNSA